MPRMTGWQVVTPLPLPSTVISLMLTGPPETLSTHNCRARVVPNSSTAFVTRPPTGGAITACPELPLVIPLSVRGWVMVTCSGYVPGQTNTVLPDGTAVTAAWMVEKCTKLGWQAGGPPATVAANKL